MSEPKKCAHAECKCICTDGAKYCSKICEDSHKYLSLKCECHHPDCKAAGL